jgi:ABC-type uncharacterized transport system permease subunit
MNLERIIVDGIIYMEQEERKHGRMATVAGILLLAVITITSLALIYGITTTWFKATDMILKTFFGFGL